MGKEANKERSEKKNFMSLTVYALLTGAADRLLLRSGRIIFGADDPRSLHCIHLYFIRNKVFSAFLEMPICYIMKSLSMITIGLLLSYKLL